MIGHRVVLRPRNLFESGDLAFAFLRRHLREVLKLLPWTVVPALGALVFQWFLKPGPFLVWLTLFAGTAIGGGVYVVLFGDLMLKPTADLRSVQRRFLRTLPSFVVTRVASWVFTSLLLGLPYAYAAFVPECAVLEQGGLSGATGRSGALMRAVPGRAAGFALVAAASIFAGAAGGELARYFLRDLFGLANGPIALFGDNVGWASALGVALATPYVAALRFLLYIDARTRREGWDLQVQMTALVQVAEHAGLRASRSEEAA